MIKKDFILRMVEEFARFLAAITKLRLEGELDKALQKIEDVFNGMIKIDPKLIKSMSVDEMMDFLLKEKKFDNHYLKMIAELLFEEGLIYVENGDPVTLRIVFDRAKIIIDYLMEHDSTYSFDWFEKLSVIDEALKE